MKNILITEKGILIIKITEEDGRITTLPYTFYLLLKNKFNKNT